MKHIYFFLFVVLFLLASCSDKDTEISFRHYVYESFTTDSIVLELGELASNSPDDGTPISYVGYDIEFPVNAVNDDVLRRLQLNVINVICDGADLTAADPFAEMKRVFAGMTLTESDSCPVDPIDFGNGQNITTHDFTVVRTITNADSLYTICISSDYYAFGAAHGFYSLSYHSFNAMTGNELTFDSLFVAGADTVFCNFMKARIPVEYKESYNEDFVFQNDPLVWIGSFYFMPDGIIFSFSPYVIGSYADGQIDCLIPASVVKPFLNKNWSHLFK